MHHFTERVVFVQRNANKWVGRVSSKNDARRLLAEEEFPGGVESWILQTYLRLREAGNDVELSDRFLEGAINIAHYDDVLAVTSSRFFIVAIKADRDRVFFPQVEVVQSPSSVEGKKDIYIPLWPQPNLRPRSGDRGADVKTLAYFGRKKYFPKRFLEKAFIDELSKLNVNLILNTDGKSWADYSQVDLIFAIRDGAPNYLESKPASKLFNAWNAGCPALVGGEPAFQFHRKTDLDFIKCESELDVIDAIRLLKSSPDIYNEMRKNCDSRRKDILPEVIGEVWVSSILESFIPEYLSWKKKPSWKKLIAFNFAKIRKVVRGNSYDIGIEFESGIVKDRTSFMRKVLWYCFDRFAWVQYRNKRNWMKMTEKF